MKRWVSCPAEVTYLLIIPGQYEKCVAVLWFLFELHKFFCGSCMFAADCFCTFFYALGATLTQYRFTDVRATTVLSFPQPSPLLWRTNVLNHSHDFSRQISPLCVLCSIVEMCNLACHLEGDGEGGKRGTGGENPEGEGGLQPGCPPFPGLSPQDSGRWVMRAPSTQIIKNKSQANGHSGKTLLRKRSTQTIKDHTKENGHSKINQHAKRASTRDALFMWREVKAIPHKARLSALRSICWHIYHTIFVRCCLKLAY